MHNFKDKLGKEWNVELSLDKVFEIEAYNFAQAFGFRPNENGELPERYIAFASPDEEFFDITVTQPKITFTMIWIICKEQGMEISVHNMEDFAKRFDGSSLNDAKFAFFGELQNFFPDRAMTLKASIQKYFDAIAEMDRQLSEKINELMTPEEIKKLVSQQANVQLDAVKREMQKSMNGLQDRYENKST